MPKVTVIIPSYNHARFIAEAINSVLQQTFQDFELLICDDASMDDSVEIIKTFKDERIQLHINQINLGACVTFNNMIKKAKGKYIALLNSDDVWYSDKLRKQVEFLESNINCGAVFTHAQIIKEDGGLFENKEHFYYKIFDQPNRSQEEWLQYFFYSGNCICHPSMLIRKSVYDGVGLYNPLMASLPDFEMWIRVVAKFEIYILQEQLIKFRILDGEQNASGNNLNNTIRSRFEYTKILETFCNVLDIKLFNNTFKDHMVSDRKQIPFEIANMLVNNCAVYLKNWALNKIYQLLLEDPDYYNRFIKPSSFTNLSRVLDIFNIFGVVDKSLVVEVIRYNNPPIIMKKQISLERDIYNFEVAGIDSIKEVWLSTDYVGARFLEVLLKKPDALGIKEVSLTHDGVIYHQQEIEAKFNEPDIFVVTDKQELNSVVTTWYFSVKLNCNKNLTEQLNISIMNYNKLMHQYNVMLTALKKCQFQLDLIKNSRIWKLRMKVATLFSRVFK